MSTESGIPDFRSPGGIWSRYQPVYYADFMSSAAARHEYWRQKAEAQPEFAKAKPNRGHEILARWEQVGRLCAVITQNIDGLHQVAGSPRVIELHGTSRSIRCLDCGHSFPPEPLFEQFLATNRVPECTHCGGDRLKTDTISFGQTLSAKVLEEALELSRQADVFITCGSSLVVQPAATLPQLAKSAGAQLAIINRDPTDQDATADVVIHASIGEVLACVDRCMEDAKVESRNVDGGASRG